MLRAIERTALKGQGEIAMEHSMSTGQRHELAEDAESFDLEAELAVAERRYAHASERSRRARDECHALEADLDPRTDAVKRARQRYDAAEVRRLLLKRQIERLEERLS
jgi:chromosome segregation ATPase